MTKITLLLDDAVVFEGETITEVTEDTFFSFGGLHNGVINIFSANNTNQTIKFKPNNPTLPEVKFIDLLIDLHVNLAGRDLIREIQDMLRVIMNKKCGDAEELKLILSGEMGAGTYIKRKRKGQKL